MMAVAFLCAVTVSTADCSRDTAVDVLPLGHADNEMQCLMGAQMTLAQLAVRSDDAFRWVVRCSPDHGANLAAVKED